MVVLLPKQVDGLVELEKDLTAPKLKAWIGKLRKAEVQVWLPKFKTTSEFRLEEKVSLNRRQQRTRGEDPRAPRLISG